jgi:hypothetical protein
MGGQMSLRDTFRSLRRGGESDGEEIPDDAPEPGEFGPRSDGVYDGGQDPDHPDGRIYLRFTGNRVRELVGSSTADQARIALTSRPTGVGVLVGEYTTSGRFSVQAPFERPVTYAVLAADDAGYTVRRTNSGTATTHQTVLTFVPDPT